MKSPVEQPPQQEAAAPGEDDGAIFEISGWKRCGVWVLGLLYRAWARTLRFTLDEETGAALRFRGEPTAILLWHNCLFLGGEIQRRYRSQVPISALVSASRDGALLASFLKDLNIKVVRGSSHRFGREAVMDLIGRLRTGEDVAITPDGPRGPRCRLKPGVLLVARRARAPLLLIGARFASARQLRSWDGFFLPRPFSRVLIRARLLRVEEVPRGEPGVAWLETQLNALCREPEPVD